MSVYAIRDIHGALKALKKVFEEGESMKLIRYACCAFLLLGFTGISIENPCSIMYPREGSMDWGEGAYLLPDIISIPVYCDTQGSIFGSLQKETRNHRILDQDEENLPFALGNSEYIGSSNYELLKVRPAYSDSFVKIYSDRKEGALYVKKEELIESGAKYYTYQELLLSQAFPFSKSDYNGYIKLGVNLKDGCLNLRKGPGTNSDKIICVNGNSYKTQDHTLLRIIESKGLWAKIEVRYYTYDGANDESGEGCVFKLADTKTGWMKAIDDNGFPNIWYSVTSY